MQAASKFRLYWANKTINYSILILITLLGVVIPAWYFGQNTLITPLILGVIAAALAESDDSFMGRIKALILTFICFAVAAFSIEILFHTPWLFATGLFISTFGFIMLGAIGPKYASIAFGSLLIAIYTMLGAHESTNIWFQPLLLLTGAAWYYFMSMIWQMFWPLQPVQLSLANVFLALANYLDAKAKLFHPVTNLAPQPMRIEAARLNAATVTTLNACKATLLTRSKRGHVDGPSDRFLNIYFIAQDIHERVSSSHYRYQDLATEFERSDVLFRFKYLLETQAQACRDIAQAIQLGNEYTHTDESILALAELQNSLAYLEEQQQGHWKRLLMQLTYLFNNLATVEKQLNNINNPDAERLEEDTLADTNPHTLKAMWQRISANLHKDSMLFRHALRMSIALTIGYGIIQLFDIDRGYWILLTTLFVCQPNYSATRQKLTARVIGTLAGLLIGVPLLTFFPSQESQLVFIVVSGVMFFAFRMNNYGYATGFITLLVLFLFNQLGEGYAVVLPRLADTLIGCALAVAAVMFILPDWQSRRLHKVMSDAIDANKQYLDQIIGQYRIGKKDNLSYRIARRQAHNNDATLTSAISTMLAEPGKYRAAVDESFRFLTLNHAMLSYISALGAHRTRIEDESIHKLVLDAHRCIHQHLDVLHQQLHQHCEECDLSNIDDAGLEQRLNEWRDEDDSSARMVLQQLHLIYRMLPELHSLASKFAVRVN
ncbi:TIGR01666 family membrane protein [Vibrio parahaemolyticus]|uniref:YccS family putative transporter n=1 Tax=Vibrio parahaemolyticus TaxID=670 RepID=UPI00070F1433|nr:YccS family putative transporter [Vibrio parahaemolyticus]ALM68532.1 Putative efflux (PET) family inner membrane protein YccS [Vibrio parahaemolyticus]AWG80973.1 TIGR01666 family membrane protein [Vibrio parahaemolyticus]AWJ81342.1 TIGR01666 family membrane protein [Vibrio parahaemolyticus]EGR2910950.1 TIGR01666 family membrane protein [Vibrio parahaemolyticus]EGR3150785.1 TIGR01666 family membrane protein [Vibrio parahaemolyticus]